ncbi:MAG TPA: hypothetical protein VN259_10320 [Xanthomonadales bacterium]|nr:hypothetical protein [Xanthomonadales bacterium]
MTNAIEQLHVYLSALDGAAHAIEQARCIRPDPGLDHAIVRLRTLLLDGYRALQQLEGAEHGVRLSA